MLQSKLALRRSPFVLALAAGLVPFLAVVLLFGGSPAEAAAPAAQPEAAAAPSTAVNLAQLTITINTSSDWTKLHLAPAMVRNLAVTSSPAGVGATKIADGISLTNIPVNGATITFNALAEDVTSATSFTATVEKGRRGAATATVRNTSASPYTVTTLTDTVSNSATNPASKALTRQQLFGSVQPTLRHADPRHLVLAFYYGWFGKASFDSPRMFDQPASGAYSAWDSTAVLDMTNQARANGIDGFIVSWSGDQLSGTQFDLALNAANATNGYATGYLEVIGANAAGDPAQPTDPAVVRARLRQLVGRSSNPAFLTSDGVPVVFVYGMYRLPVDAWQQMLADEAAAGRPVRLVGDGSLPSYASVMWGAHQYNPNQLSYDALSQWNHGRLVAQRGPSAVDPSAAPKLFAATVSPGFDNRNDKAAVGQVGAYVSRGANGERYQLTWDAALANDPDWVLVTSWNEWYEGTVVQPSVRAGDLALLQTKANAATF
ncbi:MAG: hypothetical protein QOC92_346 [Acidimicrobiaceae bacterium]